MSTMTEQPTLGLKAAAPAVAAPNLIVTEKAAEEVRRIMADQQQAKRLLLLLGQRLISRNHRLHRTSDPSRRTLSG